MSNKNSPKFTDAVHRARAEDLALMDDFRHGKKKIKLRLTRWELETDKGYKARQEVCTLYNQTRKAIKTANGMVFRKDITLSEDIDKDFLKKAKDIDDLDTHLNDFARDTNDSAINDGLAYILLDTPKNETGKEIITLRQQLDAGLVPYFVKIKHSQVLNRRIRGNKLHQITIQESVSVEDGAFGEKQVTQEKVLYIGGGKVYQDDKVVYEWKNNLKYIPIVPVYTNKVGFLDATPLFLDLAELNIKHFNYQSQLDKTLFVASNPVPLFWGEKPNKDGKVVIGVDHAFHWERKEEGGFEWAEFEGKSVDKLQEEIKNIEGRMLAIGLSILTEKEQTATEAGISHAKETSDLPSIASSLEKALNVAYGMWCDMMGKTPKGTITVNKDFKGVALSPAEAKLFLDMYNSGTITLEQFWDEMESREYLKEFDRDIAKAEIEAKNQNTDL